MKIVTTYFRKYLDSLHLFLVAHTQSAFGDYIGYVALIVLVNERFSSPTIVSIFILAEFLPVVVFGAIIGHFVDKHSKRVAAITADLLRAIAFIGIALFTSLSVMLAFAFLAGLAGAIFYSAAQSGLANMAEGKKLNNALSTQSTLTSFASILGPVLGGLFLAIFQPELLLYVNAATFFISAILISFLPLDTGRDEKQTEEVHSNQAWANLKKFPPSFLVLLILTMFVALIAGMLGVLELYFALDELGIGNTGYGILIGAYGGGMVLGNILAGKEMLAKIPDKGYVLGILLLGVGLLITSQLSSSLLAIAFFSLAGFGNGVLTVSARIILVTVIRPAKQGLAYGTRHSIESAGLVISLLSGSALVVLLGSRTALLAAGISLIAVGILGWYGFRRYQLAISPVIRTDN